MNFLRGIEAFPKDKAEIIAGPAPVVDKEPVVCSSNNNNRNNHGGGGFSRKRKLTDEENLADKLPKKEIADRELLRLQVKQWARVRHLATSRAYRGTISAGARI
ncbi:hypothetical protein EsH8_V_000113 [Colletotrichum jinshuiense]